MSKLTNAITENLDELNELLQTKNIRYGRNLPRHGLRGIVIRMNDKVQRLENLILGQARPTSDETVWDTLRDLAGYAIMALALDDIGDLSLEGDWRESNGMTPPKTPETASPEPQEQPQTVMEDIELWRQRHQLRPDTHVTCARSVQGSASSSRPLNW